MSILFMQAVKKLSQKDSDFPDRLRQIHQPPKELFVRGEDLDHLLSRPCLAVVGSRKITPYGRLVVDDIVREVAAHGVVIISGLALGVDAYAHEAALAANGLTVAVLPTSLDNVQPKTNLGLANRIIKHGGALISEYPSGMPPQRENFIARNRLVSGLADGVLVIEAADKSGTLHTANFALEQGKTVMAVPGNITSPMSVGTNRLIKTGASLITDASDVLFALGIKDQPAEQTELFAANPEEAILIDLLRSGMSDASELQNKSGLDADKFNQTITMLEINGKIRALGANHWALK